MKTTPPVRHDPVVGPAARPRARYPFAPFAPGTIDRHPLVGRDFAELPPPRITARDLATLVLLVLGCFAAAALLTYCTTTGLGLQ